MTTDIDENVSDPFIEAAAAEIRSVKKDLNRMQLVVDSMHVTHARQMGELRKSFEDEIALRDARIKSLEARSMTVAATLDTKELVVKVPGLEGLGEEIKKSFIDMHGTVGFVGQIVDKSMGLHRKEAQQVNDEQRRMVEILTRGIVDALVAAIREVRVVNEVNPTPIEVNLPKIETVDHKIVKRDDEGNLEQDVYRYKYEK